ncbi:pilus motility taxis protein HmpF [Aerosakkonema funiforme]|uniref:Uncharacterized protein n=1 Tax=Aerosakkonema funiforme FACHB-1375 TaxID=2949571 RepID=A0A926VF46_9CYAN|nr:pilus motility taxis protein HmpF [Aerosakkonema funiforme]MBD2182593.1 hypothetical protein [Aerosakkonema funiforme FACHB-1375]
MLYLAEVQKQKQLMSVKTDLKLLACQRGESWSAVPGEEIIPAPPDEANKYGEGALVLVDLSGNRQVQRINPGRDLVPILQNFSRLQEKYKNKEEEIEQWKESLTYQAQELNRREMEIQARQEQLEQMEGEFERFEQQRQEIDSSREEAERLREEIDRNRQELEGAWAHLRGEQERVKQMEAEYQPKTAIDDDQAHRIQDLLNRMYEAIASPQAVQEQLNLAFEIFGQQQADLDKHWQQLEQQRSSAQVLQDRVDSQGNNLQNRWQQWEQDRETLAQARSKLTVQHKDLELKQEQAQKLSLQLRTQEDLLQQVQRMAAMSSDVKIGQKIDVEALEKISLPELQTIVQSQKQELEKAKRFLSDQEEELELQRQTIAELQQKIRQAGDYDRPPLQAELADEQDRYQILEDSVVGSRRTVREREEIFSQHQRVLRRRQGMPETDVQDNQKIDLGPVLTQLESSRQQLAEELQKLERDIEQMRLNIQQAQSMIDHQTQEQVNQRQELQTSEQNLLSQRALVAETWGRLKLYEEMLQPVQDKLNELRQRLEAIAGMLGQIQESGDYQHHAIAEMRKIFFNIMPSHLQQQLVAS